MHTDTHQERIGIAHDLTLEERCHTLERLNQQLQLADGRKDQFMAVLGHELRNLLAPVGYSIDLMRMSPRDAAVVQECCAITDRQLKQMVRLIDDLLDVSRIARGNLTLRQEQVDLSEVIRGAIEICKPRLDERRQVLKLQSDSCPVLPVADRMRLMQVLANLLLNASKFSPCETEIELKMTADTAHATICIKDHGIGLSADELGKVFEMYSQVHPPVDGSSEGLGIGLGLAKAIVELHSGSITVKSEGSGRGCEFIVRLPCTAVL